MKIKFGIIGLGAIAARFASVLNTVEGVELVSVASRDQNKAEDFAKKFGAKKAYNSYDDLVTDSEVDVVYIALTHNFHFEAIKLCLNNKKGVLCEKPLAINKKDADELVALSKEKNMLLMEAMWTRFIPAFKKAKEWVSSGRIGDVKLVNASFCFNVPFNPENRLFNPNLAGGSLFDAGVYPIEFTTGILGENPTLVNGFCKVGKTGVDEFVTMNMSFESGALATLSCGITGNTNRDAYIYGTTGYVVVHDFLCSKKAEIYDNKNELVEKFEEDFKDGFIYEIQHFEDLYRNNKIESDIVPLKDTVACAGIFDELMNQWGMNK